MKALLGQIPFQGAVVFQPKPDSIGWLPQHYQVSIRIPVLDFISLGNRNPNRIFPSKNEHSLSLAGKALGELGASQLADKQTDELSGGEWQLVCLAQLLVQPTDVWLLDEPTASLDIYYKTKVFQFLWDQARKGKTIVLSTHDLPFIPTESGSYLYLNEGIADNGLVSTDSIKGLLDKLKSQPEVA